MKVLIVEDDIVTQRLFEMILVSRGHKVTVCPDAETAWEEYQKEPYPLIILDWLLPGMDGLKFCYQLRALPHGDRSVILMVTTRNQPEHLKEVLDAGADDYLAKPVDLGLLTIHLEIAERQVHDRSRRNMAEEKLEEMFVQIEKSRDDLLSILNHLRVGTAMIDKAGCVTFLSQPAQQLFGKKQKDILGEPWEYLCPFKENDIAQLKAMSELPNKLRTKVPVHIEISGERHYWMDIEIQDDPRNNQRYIFYFYDMSEVHGLRCLLDEKSQFQDMIGKSESMQTVFQYIRELANIASTVLIEGETGTGKELVARAIHFSSNRKTEPFVALNCAGLTESLLTSQLFGHKRGAFTGAFADSKGLFESANGGTLFLDEIGDIPMSVQTIILRVLQEREITRLGEFKPRKIDVHILAATHCNLIQEVSKGNFREDLLYRIRVARIQLPSLRERREDIPLLISSFLNQFQVEIGKPVQEVSNEAMGILMGYSWPGNVRELKSAIEFAVIRCRDSVVQAEDLPPEILNTVHPQTRLDRLYQDDRKRLLTALESAQGNRSVAARLLGMSRATFYRRLIDLNFSKEELTFSSHDKHISN
jgi:sigma-54 dependent transcriptional regulator, acetoin dehydrogenase operon transcriptional activator AcoR